MSRYVIDVPAGHEIVVGWDAPLETFFAQVRTRQHAHPIIWVGTEPHELYELEDLERALGRHRHHLTPDLATQGTKTKQFEQVGNAVPPLLAYRALEAVLAPAAREEAA